MWVSHVVDRYTTVLILQLLCILPEHNVHVQAKDTCQVGQEKNQKGQWRWVLPYEYPCECGKVIYGGMNTVTPKRPFKPVYVKEPMVGDNVGDIRHHYGLNCSEIRCPPHRQGRAQQGCTARRFPNETVTAVDNHGAPLNVSCNPPLNSDFPIGQTNVTCFTEDQRGNNKSCAFKVIVADFNECERKRHNCATNALCVNTDGSYNCSCTKGYEGDGSECVDVDECTTQSHNCSANAACHNTNGSYNCSCNQGYEGDGFECVDVDECTTQSHNCSANAACHNTNGSYNCSCNQGYGGGGFECADVDECTTHSHNCSANAACHNTDGSYNCSCYQGFEGDGFECVVNTDGSYNCSCNQGYEGDGFQCVDVDECTTHSHNCSANAACHNTNGSYNCSCNQGYGGDGFKCVDIDECRNDISNNCDENAECTNTDGSFSCQCEAGYSGNGITCKHINKCEDGHNICGDSAMCINTEESFSCACEEGCSNDDVKCHNIYECQHDDSGELGVCSNTERTFTCNCDAAGSGEEFNCDGAWILVGRYCFAHGSKKTFEQAHDHCSGMGGDLVSIHGEDEQWFLKKHMTDEGYDSDTDKDWWGYWIGFSDMNTEVFEWTDGTQDDFEDWHSNQPNNDGDCVVMAKKKKGRWFDESCGNIYPYICKKNL